MSGIDPTVGRILEGVRRRASKLYWRAYGSFLKNPPVPSSPGSLLFVCKGNICRSPFAEASARRLVPEGDRIQCRSAGLEVKVPEACPREAVAAAERFGIDLSGHRSRPIDKGLVAGADMVLAMEAWQLGRIRRIFPAHTAKMFLLPLFDENPPGRSDEGRRLNIRDPYGRTLQNFIECFERIEACLEGIFSGIRDPGMREP